MKDNFRALTVCSLAIIIALLVVGAVSHGVLRHVVQTSPLWIAIGLGVRRSAWSKWAALPCFIFWLLLMTAIWLFLLGWARVVSGTFSPTEVAMTLVVGAASVYGIVRAFAMRTQVGPGPAALAAVLAGLLQVAALRVSLLPAIAHR